MLKKDKTLVLVASMVVVFLLVTVFSVFKNSDLAQGSVIGGNEYNTTVIKATADKAVATSTNFVKTGYGSIGSIVYVGASSTGTYPLLSLWNATSTSAATSSAEYTNLIAEIGGSNTTLGTYQFDATFSKGLMYEISEEFDGVFILTWR